MSADQYRPQVGDRVRVVIEGQVISKGDIAFTVGEDEWTPINPEYRHVVAVEKVSPPLPTTPGSVIKWSCWTYIRDDTGCWRSQTGSLLEDDEFRNVRDVKVIFDAGAAS